MLFVCSAVIEILVNWKRGVKQLTWKMMHTNPSSNTKCKHEHNVIFSQRRHWITVHQFVCCNIVTIHSLFFAFTQAAWKIQFSFQSSVFRLSRCDFNLITFTPGAVLRCDRDLINLTSLLQIKVHMWTLYLSSSHFLSLTLFHSWWENSLTSRASNFPPINKVYLIWIESS